MSLLMEMTADQVLGFQSYAQVRLFLEGGRREPPEMSLLKKSVDWPFFIPLELTFNLSLETAILSKQRSKLEWS